METNNTTGDNSTEQMMFDPDKMNLQQYCIAVRKATNEQIEKLRAVTNLLNAMASERNSRNFQKLIKLLESGL